jgi:hypothetical protein
MLVDVKLVAKMEEKARRFARKTASGGEDEVGGNQEVWDVGSIDLTGDGGVVPGGAGVLEDGAAIGGNPDETG